MNLTRIKAVTKLFSGKIYDNIVVMLRSHGKLSAKECAYLFDKGGYYDGGQYTYTHRAFHFMWKMGVITLCDGIDQVHLRYTMNEREYSRLQKILESI